MQCSDWLGECQNCLPPELKLLPTITAEHYLCIDSDPMLFIEGPSFDREGNLFVCCSVPVDGVTPRVYKIAPEGKCSILCYTEDIHVMGMAIHKDGRLFIAALHDGILILSPNGELLDHFHPQINGRKLVPNDLAFHAGGDLYFTDFSGSCSDPCGGIIRLKEETGYHEPEQIAGGMIYPNGISFSPDMRRLMIGESGRNAVWQLELGVDGCMGKLGVPLSCVYKSSGSASLDGNRTDSAGFLYQTLNHGGRVLIFNNEGVPVGNVVVPERGSGKYDMTANLVLCPGKKEAVLLASGRAGIHLFRFPTFAAAQVPYSHM